MNSYLLEVQKWYQENKGQLEYDLQYFEGRTKEAFASILAQFENVFTDKDREPIGEQDISKLVEQVYALYEQNKAFVRAEGRQPFVPIGGHRLPPLPYPYDALEPYIAKEIMYLHHDKHHQSYVDGLNKAEMKMEEARQTGDFDLIKHWEREAAFHGAGHYLHTIFWEIMAPDAGGEPEGELLQAIERDFGSFEQFKEHFTQAADQVEGGGWAMLVWAPRSGRMEILQAEKHQNLSQQDMIPLLVLDVWEHAYYLQYLNEKKDYVEAWWNLVNWPAVADRYNKAKTIRWKLA
ncbi:Fe-Mn family superoxide dismutase [Oceanobacillus polygoni]|uniref:superoxide dismutase n=1 Tax=Oceanobacillus polygoni TaxID=1235259 RepID=A0A9X1CEK2_9BACI|nr:Fe-Mn family superoxide dismutase [Oceanobacillus polygoni]